MRLVQVSQADMSVQRRRLSGFSLHTADLSVAVLADRLKPDAVLSDDLQLRKAMETQGYKVVGSVGVIVRAFSDGVINKVETRAAVEELLEGSSLHTSRAFRLRVYDLLDSLL